MAEITADKIIYGTSEAAFISDQTVDAYGNSINALDANGVAEHILVDAGAGDDNIDIGLEWDTITGEPIMPSDTIEVLAGDGDDQLYLNRSGVSMDGGAGDDHFDIWLYDDTYAEYAAAGGLQLTGGEGADTFQAVSWNETGEIVISDFEPGLDVIQIWNEFEEYETIDFSQNGSSSRFTATDTADGAELLVYHSYDYPDGHIEVREVLNFTLKDVTLADLTGTVTSGNYLTGTEGRDRFRSETIDANGNGLTDLADTIDAGGGPDSIRLDTSGDVILAGDGDDFVLVRGAGNRIEAGDGDDRILTRWGGNTVDGGAGDDDITCDLRSGGTFSLTGGEGADSFIFASAKARSGASIEITDFDMYEDRLVIGGVEIDLTDLPDNILGSETDTGMILDFGRNDVMEITWDLMPV
ncbi:MAG: hypothetical protein ACK5LJ_03345 [Paracoccus sp. (in: a-proteobacteria)]